MIAKKRSVETCIDVPLDEPLTSDSCTKLIMELIKYILHQKQQIPLSYDTLVQLQPRLKPTDRNSNTTKMLLNSLRSISENITSELLANSCDVREVIVIIGATASSPKLCIRVELPDEMFSSQSHMEYYHSSRKPLLSLMRSILDCQEFQEAMTVPLGITNTFVLLQKSDSKPTSDFFLPKPQYTPPSQITKTFSIKFCQNFSSVVRCGCKDTVKVYHDIPLSGAEKILESEDRDDYRSSKNTSTFPYLWYQSREVIKGFKFSR